MMKRAKTDHERYDGFQYPITNNPGHVLSINGQPTGNASQVLSFPNYKIAAGDFVTIVFSSLKNAENFVVVTDYGYEVSRVEGPCLLGENGSVLCTFASELSSF